VDGVTRELSEPFIVLATQNPIELEGTFPLPEAQLDRFFVRTALGYPDADEEVQIVRDQRHGHPLGDLKTVVRLEEVESIQHATEEVYVDDLLQRWVIDLVRATRDLDIVAIGASVRGSLALERAARAWALLSDRDFVVPEDIESLLLPVLGHRILFTPSFLVEVRKVGRTQALQDFRDRCLAAAPRPQASLGGDGEVVQLGERPD
jgi:MoxR-like ATPase